MDLLAIHRAMFSFLSGPGFLPCVECGASVARGGEEEHVCDSERQIDYRLLQLKDDIAAFDAELSAYLDSPAGRFDIWDAERRRPPLQEN